MNSRIDSGKLRFQSFLSNCIQGNKHKLKQIISWKRDSYLLAANSVVLFKRCCSFSNLILWSLCWDENIQYTKLSKQYLTMCNVLWKMQVPSILLGNMFYITNKWLSQVDTLMVWAISLANQVLESQEIFHMNRSCPKKSSPKNCQQNSGHFCCFCSNCSVSLMYFSVRGTMYVSLSWCILHGLFQILGLNYTYVQKYVYL